MDPVSDAIREDQVDIQFIWYANERTEQAIRQARLMGFGSPFDYLHQAMAAVIASNESNTIKADDGRLRNGGEGYDKDGLPKNV